MDNYVNEIDDKVVDYGLEFFTEYGQEAAQYSLEISELPVGKVAGQELLYRRQASHTAASISREKISMKPNLRSELSCFRSSFPANSFNFQSPLL